MPLVIGRVDAQSFGHANQLRQALHPHFLHDAAAVNFDGFLTNAEFSRDLFVKQPADDQRHYFPLASSKGIMAPGIRTSRIKQLGASGSSPLRNSCPDPKVLTLKPIAPMSFLMAARADRSSSTTKTI